MEVLYDVTGSVIIVANACTGRLLYGRLSAISGTLRPSDASAMVVTRPASATSRDRMVSSPTRSQVAEKRTWYLAT